MSDTTESLVATTGSVVAGDASGRTGAFIDFAGASHGWRRTWARFRHKRAAMASVGFLLVAIVAALIAPWIAPYRLGEASTDYVVGPSSTHWLGTDNVGYDTLSQVLFGLRTSLFASSVAVALAATGGVLVGLCSGYFGGRIDRLLMRFMEAVMVIPELILAIVILGILGPSIVNAMIGLAIAFIPAFARLIRGQVLAVREEPFVEAAQVIGCRSARIIRKHVFPNVLPFLVVQVCMNMGFMLLAEGALAFLGLSAQPPETSLGRLLQQGFTNINTTMRLILVPGLVITLLSISFNLVADGLRDSLAKYDPGDLVGSGRT
jgi:peptide/nickel transport system permease protein